MLKLTEELGGNKGVWSSDWGGGHLGQDRKEAELGGKTWPVGFRMG